MNNHETKKEIVWQKVTLDCGRNMQVAYSGDGCGSCESNTNNSGQATCC